MPKIKLTSFGAAEEVTGSCHLLEIDNYKILVDCGLFQGSHDNYLKNWEAFAFKTKEINAVILTHAHLDHCGRLPLLAKNGYQGKTYTTQATSQLAELIMIDNQAILAEKAKEKNLPLLYTASDVKKMLESWELVSYYHEKKITNEISLKFYQAGHILGAAIVEIKIKNPKNGTEKIFVFSGDLGGEDMPLVQSVDYPDKADVVVMESTYGNREHENKANREQKLLTAVKEVTIKNSVLIISIFAMERAQDVLQVLNDYYENHLDFRVPVYLDSPLATKATKIYRQHLNLLKPEVQDLLKHDRDIFTFPHLKITPQQRESQKINSSPNPKIILAGSGMAEGGRLVHHLARYIDNPNNHILFMGFQVPGTLGHSLTNGAYDFDYYGKNIKVKAVIDQIDGFSAHADKTQLLKWLGHFQNKPQVYLSHGDKAIMEEFIPTIKETLDLNAKILKNKESVLFTFS
ncbi:MBL fold metallo-hydrolase [Patescibacteria group bacterium]|nr:MBL fold metallo-hydrolase [Patescibacteria group bacterium]